MATRARPLPRHYLQTLAMAAVAALAIVATACTTGGSLELPPADAPIAVEVSPTMVTFQNKTGLPLTTVTVSIVPYGPGGEFTRRFSRIENTIKREVALSEFRGRDGTPLNLRVTRPKTVRVRAEDQTGKTYEVEVPWK
jgi:hypothetical protein